jgi:hypothetical protein
MDLPSRAKSFPSSSVNGSKPLMAAEGGGGGESTITTACFHIR